MSKERAAKIANTPNASKKGGEKSSGGGSSSGGKNQKKAKAGRKGGKNSVRRTAARGYRVGPNLQPFRAIYLPVGDLGESLRRVPEEGGRVIEVTTRADGAYAHATDQDAVGAYLTLAAG